MVLEREAASGNIGELQEEIATLEEATKSLRQDCEANISCRDLRWRAMGMVGRALHRSSVLKDQALTGYEDGVIRTGMMLERLITLKTALEDRLGYCERHAEAELDRARPQTEAAPARAFIAQQEEARARLDKIHETISDLDKCIGKEKLPKRVQSAALPRRASTADKLCKVESERSAPGAPFSTDIPVSSDIPAPSPFGSGTIAIPDPVPTAASQTAPPLPRNSRAVAVIAAAGLLALSAAGLVAVQETDLFSYAASASRDSPPRTGGGAEAAARAALLPAPPLAAAKGQAAAVPRQAVAKPESLPVAYEGSAQIPGASAAPLAPPRLKHAAPPRARAVPRMPPRTEPARTAPSTPARRTADRSLGQSLRQAGDMRILEGDVAAARLFYERAADAGDARAALDLGNSFNPAYLARLGVVGMRGDVVAAARWYRRALSLGNPDAETAWHTLPERPPLAPASDKTSLRPATEVSH